MKNLSTCPGLNFVQSIFSCVSTLTNPDVELSWAKFSSSLVPVNASVSQSEEVFYRSNITINNESTTT